MNPPTRPTRGFYIFLILLIAGIWGAQLLMAEKMCGVRAADTKLEHRWSRDTGCQVKLAGEWRSIGDVRVQR